METRTVSIIIPTLNEAGNIRTLLSGIIELSQKEPSLNITEVVIVDDGSKDGTDEIVSGIARETNYPLIKLVERNGKYGLLSAQIDGAKVATGEKVVIMDGDLQHPIDVIPELISNAIGKDLVVASRYGGGRSIRKPLRGLISRVATGICHVTLPRTARTKDPLSGFFIVQRKFIADLTLSHSIKIKILPYIIARNPSMQIFEVPYCFIERENGRSKIVDRKFKFVIDYMGDIISMMKISQKPNNMPVTTYAHKSINQESLQRKG